MPQLNVVLADRLDWVDWTGLDTVTPSTAAPDIHWLTLLGPESSKETDMGKATVVVHTGEDDDDGLRLQNQGSRMHW